MPWSKLPLAFTKTKATPQIRSPEPTVSRTIRICEKNKNMLWILYLYLWLVRTAEMERNMASTALLGTIQALLWGSTPLQTISRLVAAASSLQTPLGTEANALGCSRGRCHSSEHPSSGPCFLMDKQRYVIFLYMILSKWESLI